MKKISANTLEAALLEASQYFNCSLTQIEYEILQNPSNGIFGFCKKEAIIVANKKQATQTEATNTHIDTTQHKPMEQVHEYTQAKIDTPSNTIHDNYTPAVDPNIKDTQHTYNHTEVAKSTYGDNYKQNTFTNTMQVESQEHRETTALSHVKIAQQDSMQKNVKTHDWQSSSIDEKVRSDFDTSFYDKDSDIPWQDSPKTTLQHTKSIESTCQEVQAELTELLQCLPLELNKIQVTPHDEHTIFILIDGLDAALLIGQKGYRYKSLSYLLFNWINTCYGYGVRLEIAQFLKNQEEMMRAYLEPIIESAKIHGKAQTKPLDGVLTHIALKMLRDALPNKYIVFRETAEGEKYITISEFLNTFNNVRNNIHGFGNLPKY